MDWVSDLWKLIAVIFILIFLMKIDGKLERIIEEKTLRVTEVGHSYDIKSYGSLYLPGEYKGTKEGTNGN